MDILHLPPLRVDVERPLQFPWGKPFKFNIVLCVWTTQNQNESRFSSDESDDRFACCIILGSTVSDGQSRHEHSKLCRAQVGQVGHGQRRTLFVEVTTVTWSRAVSLWNSVALTDSHRVLHSTLSMSRNRVTKFVRVPGSGFQCVREY